MGTLVIHPKDGTTDFLREIYIDKDWDVINSDVPYCTLLNEIKRHDRIVMLGHGTESGLIGFDGFIINEIHANLLKQKDCVGIWCNADIYFNRHELNGFYTGMIVSEMQEADMFGIRATQREINYSNTLLADVVGKAINRPDMLTEVKYGYYDEENPIICYNMENIYFK